MPWALTLLGQQEIQPAPGLRLARDVSGERETAMASAAAHSAVALPTFALHSGVAVQSSPGIPNTTSLGCSLPPRQSHWSLVTPGCAPFCCLGAEASPHIGLRTVPRWLPAPATQSDPFISLQFSLLWRKLPRP